MVRQMHQVNSQHKNQFEYLQLIHASNIGAKAAGLERTWQINKAAEVELLDKERILELFGRVRCLVLWSKVIEELFDVTQGSIDLMCPVTLVFAGWLEDLRKECEY